MYTNTQEHKNAKRFHPAPVPNAINNKPQYETEIPETPFQRDEPNPQFPTTKHVFYFRGVYSLQSIVLQQLPLLLPTFPHPDPQLEDDLD